MCAFGAKHAAARPLENSDLPVELRDNNIAATLQAEKHDAAHRGGWTQVGEASYYRQTRRFFRTASGERFNQNAMTAAHHSLPLGTKVLVTNLDNGKTVIVRINDRPADSNPRVIDLAQRAASELGMMHNGVANVELSILPDSTPIEVAEAPADIDPLIHARHTHHVALHRAVAHHIAVHTHAILASAAKNLPSKVVSAPARG